MLDFSNGSDERRLLALLAKQAAVPVVSVNEGVTGREALDQAWRESWLVALETTRGMSGIR
jgi:hypothetical protein